MLGPSYANTSKTVFLRQAARRLHSRGEFAMVRDPLLDARYVCQPTVRFHLVDLMWEYTRIFARVCEI